MNSKRKKIKKPKTLLGSLLAIIVLLVGGYFGIDLSGIFNENSTEVEGVMEISYLDVGQGDSIYIKVNDFDILIDAGPKSSSEKLLSQLKDKNIDDFEMIIATHPHEDHIGGMADVLKEYDVESFYMPKLSHTTKTFENMVTTISNKGLKIKQIKEGMSFDLGEGAKMEVYSPIYESYEEFNDYSPIMKLTYGDTSFIFTGDAEAHAEEEVVLKYPKDLKADVLKCGHHGSSTSSTEEFLEAVKPEYGVISCGVNNKYGHPHKETLQKISNFNIKVYRTDLQGQIIATSDGKNITFKTEK